MDEEEISQSKKNIEIGDNLDDISIDELVKYLYNLLVHLYKYFKKRNR